MTVMNKLQSTSCYTPEASVQQCYDKHKDWLRINYLDARYMLTLATSAVKELREVVASEEKRRKSYVDVLRFYINGTNAIFKEHTASLVALREHIETLATNFVAEEKTALRNEVQDKIDELRGSGDYIKAEALAVNYSTKAVEISEGVTERKSYGYEINFDDMVTHTLPDELKLEMTKVAEKWCKRILKNTEDKNLPSWCKRIIKTTSFIKRHGHENK